VLMEEDAIVALFTLMIRNGIIDDDTVIDAVEDMEAVGKPMAAHQLRCLLIEAAAPSHAERRQLAVRASLKAIDGGNRD